MSNEAPKKAAPGWYQDPVDGDRDRYWTGSEWAPRVQVIEPDGSGRAADGYLGIGVVVLILAGILFAYNGSDGDGLTGAQIGGLVLSFPGWVLLAIGIVAKGVQVGRRIS